MIWKTLNTAPTDIRVLLKSADGIRSAILQTESFGKKLSHPRWQYDSWPSDGCGCCSYENAPPEAWMEIP